MNKWEPDRKELPTTFFCCWTTLNWAGNKFSSSYAECVMAKVWNSTPGKKVVGKTFRNQQSHILYEWGCVCVCGCVSLLGQQSHHTLAAMWPPTTRTPPARDKKKYKNDSDPCDVGLWGSRKQQQQKKKDALPSVWRIPELHASHKQTHTQTHNPSEYWVRMGKVLSTLLHSLERARERFSPAWQSSKTVSPHPLTVLPRKDCAFFRCTVISRSQQQQQQQDGTLHRARKTISTLTRTCTHT